MPQSNQIGLLKEQLRVKSMELKKRDSERAKQEDKVQQVIKISRKKLSELKKEIAEKENLIRDSSLRDHSLAKPESKDSETGPEQNFKFFKNLKLSKAVQKLKKENLSLTQQIKVEKSNREQLGQEKARLLEEIKKLKGSSEEISQLKKQIVNIDRESRDSQRKYKKLLQEKTQLLANYNKIIAEKKNEKSDAQITTDANQKLTNELTALNVEKENLESELKKNKQIFEKKLTEKIKRVEEEWGKKTKVLRQQKDRINRFADQVMDEGEAPAWMVTYSDMATLLLTFFILYYSIAAQNVGKFKKAILGETETTQSMIELIDSTKIKTSLKELTKSKPSNIIREMKDFVTEDNEVGITQDNSKIVMRIPGKTLFQPASAVLEKEGWPLLEKVAGIFKNYKGYKVHIQGHTDDDPISTEKFPSNWELSATRATAVLRFFVDKGLDPKRLTATGYADTFPLSPNYAEQGRANNRRVEFVLEKITQ